MQAGYDVIMISLPGHFTLFCMTDSERATMTSWWRSIVTFCNVKQFLKWPKLKKIARSSIYLGCMVSEITRFYCKPDMMSLWFLRQGVLYAILHDGFWKSDHDFLIAFIVTFYLGCMVSEIMRFYCKPDMTSSWFLRQGALYAILHNRFWKSDHDFLIAFHSNFLPAMHGFRDNEVLLPTGYDVIVSAPPGGRCTPIFRTDSERATMTS